MWKLVDCGTYPWFVRETKKYFHCVYSLTEIPSEPAMITMDHISRRFI